MIIKCQYKDCCSCHKDGHEWDADLNVSLGGPFVMGVRAARYEADRFDTDTTKLWVYFEAKY